MEGVVGWESKVRGMKVDQIFTKVKMYLSNVKIAPNLWGGFIAMQYVA